MKKKHYSHSTSEDTQKYERQKNSYDRKVKS